MQNAALSRKRKAPLPGNRGFSEGGSARRTGPSASGAGCADLYRVSIRFITAAAGRPTPAILAAIIGDVTEETPAESNSSPSENHDRISLNTRELEVLRLLVQGLSNKEIATKLEISESAVKNTLQQLFTKNGVRTRSQLVRVALEHHRNLL